MRLLFRCCWALLAWQAASAFSFTQAAETQKLRWRFRQGDRWQVIFKQTIEHSLSVGDKPTTMSTFMGMEMHWRVEEVRGEGQAVLLQSFQRLLIRANAPPHKTIYDTASKEKPADDQREVADALLHGWAQRSFGEIRYAITNNVIHSGGSEVLS